MKKYFNFIRKSIIRHKAFLVQGLGMILFLTMLQASIPLAMRKMISEVTVRQSVLFLTVCVLIYCAVLLLYNVIDVIWMKYLDRLGGKILLEVREKLYAAISRGDYEELLSVGKEKIKNILYMDTLNVYSSVACFGIQIAANTFLLFVFFGVSASVNWQLSIVLMAAAAAGFGISYLSRRPIANASRRVNLKMKEDNETLNEYVDRMELTKTNHLDTYSVGKMKESLQNFIQTSLKSDTALIFLRNVISQFHQIVSFAIAAFLSMTAGESSAADLVFYLCVVDLILATSQNIESLVYSLIKLLPAYENIDRILELDRPDTGERIGQIREIEFRNVGFAYRGTQQKIFEGKNYQFRQGDIVRISGANGSGKSTFVKLLTGLLTPTEGDILLNGIPGREVSSDSLKNEIFYISQDEIFLNDTVHNYMEAMLNRPVGEEELQCVREKVQLDASVTEIANNGLSMSGGQRKKLLMMRLLLGSQNVSVLILDELEAGLDAEAKAHLIQLKKNLVEMRKDAIIFIISHAENEDIPFTKRIEL